jgi:hypothetical protein
MSGWGEGVISKHTSSMIEGINGRWLRGRGRDRLLSSLERLTNGLIGNRLAGSLVGGTRYRSIEKASIAVRKVAVRERKLLALAIDETGGSVGSWRTCTRTGRRGSGTLVDGSRPVVLGSSNPRNSGGAGGDGSSDMSELLLAVTLATEAVAEFLSTRLFEGVGICSKSVKCL